MLYRSAFLPTLVCATTLTTACDSTLPPMRAEPHTALSAPLLTELRGTAERVWFQYTESPEVTENSYAVATVGGCSAFLIGPSILASAGHCGGWFPDNKDLIVHFSRYDESGTRVTSAYYCRHLLKTYPDGDVELAYCPDRPGDTLGWLETERRAPRKNEATYALWGNVITHTTPPSGEFWGNHTIYSPGRVGWVGLARWSEPGGDCNSFTPLNIPRGAHTTNWGRSGASGSPVLSARTHRVIIGPTTGAPREPEGGPARSGTYWSAQFEYGWVPPPVHLCPDGMECDPDCGVPDVLASEIAALGLNPADYIGSLDADGDYVFDIQEDIEAAAPLRNGVYQDIGFELTNLRPRWSILGTRSQLIEPDSTLAVSTRDIAQDDEELVARSPAIHTADRDLPVSFEVLVEPWRAAARLRVCIDEFCAQPEVEAGRWQRVSLRLPTAGEASLVAPLEFYVGGQQGAMLKQVSIGTPTDYSSPAWRRAARIPGPGFRAFVWPVDEDTWAAAVRHRPGNSALQGELDVAHRFYPVKRGQRTLVCLQFKNSQREPIEEPQWQGALRVFDDGVAVAGANFTPGDDWGEACTTPFVPAGDSVELRFGHIPIANPQRAQRAWLAGAVRDVPHYEEAGEWSPWRSHDRPTGTGDFEFQRECSAVAAQCRRRHDGAPLWRTGEKVECTAFSGLRCLNDEQTDGQCDDYEYRYLCD